MRSQSLNLRFSEFGIKLSASRNLCCLLLSAAVLASYWRQLAGLVIFSFSQDQYSYIVLIPAVSLALGFRQRAAIFSEVEWAPLPGLVLMFSGLAGTAVQARLWPVESAASLSATIACVWALLVGIFALSYGTHALRAGLFPILFSVLIVPLPPRLLDSASLILQKASCQLTFLLMTLAGTPVLQKGFVLSTPGGGIEVAAQCSGIRSTLGLLIGSLVASHLFLRSTWKKTALAFSVVPVSVFKNALRIVTLYWLGVHTDEHFLTGALHRYGGIPFSVLSLGVLGPLLWALRKSEALPRLAVSRDNLGSSRRVALRPTVDRALSD
ncbi:MAG TPA: exosortase/archaeosortase family protein [Terriglobia bacterium]